MYKIDLAFWYRFGTAMQAFVGLPWDPHRSDVYAAALLAKQWAQAIQPITSLPLSAAAAERLDVQLDALLDEIREQDATAADGAPAAEISIGRRMDATTSASEFQTILLAELAQLDTYHVAAKGTYSTQRLLASADDGILGTYTSEALPIAVRDEIRQWGRCFAFQLPTASGFHIMRATEIAILNYLRVMKGDAAKVEPRSWHRYIEVLKSAGADEGVTSSLDQIRRLHRNPLMHPEDTLTLEQADALYGLAKATIVAIAAEITRRESAPLSAPLT